MPEQTSPSRRDVLKGTAALAGAAAAASFMSVPAVHAASDETIKIALIGCGGRGSAACNQALNTEGPVKLIAIADAFEDNAKSSLKRIEASQADRPGRVDVKEDHIFWGFDAYQKAIAAGPDLVILATPPGFRPIHFKAAVEAGKHVFMEKPVATDAGGIRSVLATAEEAKKKNLKVGVGLQRHHDPKYIETIKRIHDGELGDIIMTRAYWNDAGVWVRPRKPGQTEMEYQMRNWYYFVWLCGDHINEQHIHNLDVINWVKKGPPVKAQGQGGRQVRTGIDNGEIYDHHFVEFTYGDGTTCLSQCRHQANTWKSVTEHAHGSKLIADVSGAKFHPFGKPDEIVWRFQPDKSIKRTDPYQIEHDDLFAAVRQNKPYNEAEYGAHSTMTSLLGRMCTYSGQEIKWDDAIKSEVSVMPKVFAFDADPPTKPNAEGRYQIAMPGVTKVV